MKIIHIVENLDKGAVENWLVNIFIESRKTRPGWEWTFYCILGKEGRLDEKVKKLIAEFDEFMNDDFSTAKVLANMFELVPMINSMRDKTIPVSVLSKETFDLLQKQMKIFIEDIFGLKSITGVDNDKMRGVMQLLIDIRKEARGKKDFATSDRIRNQLQQFGILLKDEKDGSVSWSVE